jgi:hypothetical protein
MRMFYALAVAVILAALIGTVGNLQAQPCQGLLWSDPHGIAFMAYLEEQEQAGVDVSTFDFTVIKEADIKAAYARKCGQAFPEAK